MTPKEKEAGLAIVRALVNPRLDACLRALAGADLVTRSLVASSLWKAALLLAADNGTPEEREVVRGLLDRSLKDQEALRVMLAQERAHA